jgi:hypothetical protein
MKVDLNQVIRESLLTESADVEPKLEVEKQEFGDQGGSDSIPKKGTTSGVGVDDPSFEVKVNTAKGAGYAGLMFAKRNS